MELITKKEFATLANHHAPHGISIFLPTQRAGEEVDQYHARTKLKNHLQELDEELDKSGFSPREIKAKLTPANKLLDDKQLWHNLSDGLAIFIGNDFFGYYTLPVYFEDFRYTADHFYLRPLMPMFNGDGRFFLLTLSLQEVKFYECTRHTITKVYVEDLVPADVSAVVGSDYEEKSLQHHSIHGTAPGAKHHGQGRNSDKDRDEALRFCQEVNRGLMQMLHDEDAPMIVHCDDALFAIYQQANTYPLLHEHNISGSPEEEDVAMMHERAWNVMEPVFTQKRNEKVAQFRETDNVGKIATTLNDIIPAAVNGRIDTLFLQNREDVYGVFHEAAQEVRVDASKESGNASLLNLAAIHTFLQGGKVYLMEADEMPVKDAMASALLRY